MAKWWSGYPWRVVQTNFREIDTLNFDEDRFLAQLEALCCNAVMLNAAGLLASYDSALADHITSPYLEGFDLRRLVERCHERGIKVIARTDFSKIPLAVFGRHPDWAYRKPDGEPLVYNGYVQTCLSGGYQGGYMDEILKEMLETIPFDGIYCNMGSATGYVVDYSMNRYGPCQCQACKAAFRGKYGMEIPLELSRTDKTSMVYFRFQQELAGAQKKRITELLRRIAPDLAYCSVDYVRQEANSELGRGLPHWQYQAASNARTIRGMGQEADVADVDFMGFAYRHVAADAPLQELRLWQTLANFGGIDFYTIGRLYDNPDRSALPRVQRVFAYAAEHEALTYGVQPLADALLVRDAYVIPDAEERGWIRALTELHVPFAETLTAGLARMDLDKYKLILLPEKARLAPPVLEKLRAYVEQGGMVLATGMLADAALFGAADNGRRDDTALGAMLQMEEAERPLFMLGKSYWQRAYTADTKRIGRYLPPERFGPPELCYPTEAPTDLPALTQRPVGKGFALTIPWYPATNYYTDGCENFLLFLKHALLTVCGLRPLSETASPMVELTHGRKGETELVHFVNGSGHFGNSFFDPPTLCDQSLTIPWPHKTAACENLDEPGNVRWSFKDGQLTITIPRLGFHACVAIKEEA